MIAGALEVAVVNYQTVEEAQGAIDEFLT